MPTFSSLLSPLPDQLQERIFRGEESLGCPPTPSFSSHPFWWRTLLLELEALLCPLTCCSSSAPTLSRTCCFGKMTWGGVLNLHLLQQCHSYKKIVRFEDPFPRHTHSGGPGPCIDCSYLFLCLAWACNSRQICHLKGGVGSAVKQQLTS